MPAAAPGEASRYAGGPSPARRTPCRRRGGRHRGAPRAPARRPSRRSRRRSSGRRARRPRRRRRPPRRARRSRSRSRRASRRATRGSTARPRPSRRRPGRSTVDRTRSISVTMCRARRTRTSSARLLPAAGRRERWAPRAPRGRLALGPAGGVAAVDQRVGDPVSVTSRTTPEPARARDTGVWVSSPKSSSSAVSGAANSAIAWSMPPVGAPAISDSARMQAASSRCRSGPSSPSTGEGGDRHGDRALHRRRAGQPAAQRHRRVEHHVEAGHVDPVLAQRPHHARGVRRPPGHAAGGQVGEPTLPGLVEPRTRDPQHPVVAGGGRGVRRVGQRQRQQRPPL